MFNPNHPSFQRDVWSGIAEFAKDFRDGVKGELNGFDKAMIKREIFHLMFVKPNQSDLFDTISYSKSEHFDKYEGITRELSNFAVSGIKDFGLTFKEYLELPPWVCEWLIEFARVRNDHKERMTKEATDELEKELGIE